MSSVDSFLIRRGTELIHARLEHREQHQILAWLPPAIAISTAVIFGLAILWVDYTCAQVIATLAAVENTTPTVYVRLDSDCSDFHDPIDPEPAAPPNAKPITRGLRSTIKHLRAHGGIWSTLRGFHVYLAFTGVELGVRFLIGSLSHSPFGTAFGQFVASMLLATWQMAWVHLVIADKSPRKSYRRIFGFQNWSNIAPAAALYNGLISVGAFFIPNPLGWTVGLTLAGMVESPGFLVLLIMLVVPVLIVPVVSFPARAVFIRVAASMLSEEDDPIVPFDRLFGDKAKPATIGGSRNISLRTAWTTFEWGARVRFLKTILKSLAIEIALIMVGFLTILVEMMLVSLIGTAVSSHS